MVIFVLGIVLLTAFLLTRLMDRAVVELAAESKGAGRNGMRQEACSALEASLAVLADYAAIDNGLHATEQGWSRPLEQIGYQPTPGYQVEVSVEDETGRLSLPAADEIVLHGYLEAIGVPATSIDELIDALLVWTRQDHVAQSLSYDAENFGGRQLPYRASQRPLRSFEELRAIPAAFKVFFDEDGHWNEIGEKFRAGASLYHYTSSNANTAEMEGMLALGIDPMQADSLLKARELRKGGSSYFRSSADMSSFWGATTPPPAGLGADVSCLHANIKVKQGARLYQLDAWFCPSGAVQIPLNQPRSDNKEASGNNQAEPPAKRGVTRNKVDSPFQILELRENHGN